MALPPTFSITASFNAPVGFLGLPLWIFPYLPPNAALILGSVCLLLMSYSLTFSTSSSDFFASLALACKDIFKQELPDVAAALGW